MNQPERRRISRRRFLCAAGAAAVALPAIPCVARAAYPSPFPARTPGTPAGGGTYQCGDAALLAEAAARGIPLLDTSPDYRDGELETWVGRAVERSPGPVTVMTQIPAAAWEEERRETAFHRALDRSLDLLGRKRVDALLVRNATVEQLEDPAFRAFAVAALGAGKAGAIGASGHGRAVEAVLERAAVDPLLEVVLFGAHLAGGRGFRDLLAGARRGGTALVAMKTREAALWDRRPGWEREQERRRHRPWDGAWDGEFTRRALAYALARTRADTAVVSLHTEADLRAALETG